MYRCYLQYLQFDSQSPLSLTISSLTLKFRMLVRFIYRSFRASHTYRTMCRVTPDQDSSVKGF